VSLLSRNSSTRTILYKSGTDGSTFRVTNFYHESVCLYSVSTTESDFVNSLRLQGYLVHNKTPHPQDHHSAIDRAPTVGT